MAKLNKNGTIYCFTINNSEKHKGLCCIGYTKMQIQDRLELLFASTALSPTLAWTSQAKHKDGTPVNINAFRKYLRDCGIRCVYDEWFEMQPIQAFAKLSEFRKSK